MIHGKYRYTHLSSGDLLRDEVGVMCSCLLTVRLLILRRIFEQNKMRIRRNVMKVKMMFLFQVMLNSARGMQIFGTMEKGVLVPDVSLILITMVTGQDDDGNDDHGHGEGFFCSGCKFTIAVHHPRMCVH